MKSNKFNKELFNEKNFLKFCRISTSYLLLLELTEGFNEETDISKPFEDVTSNLKEYITSFLDIIDDNEEYNHFYQLALYFDDYIKDLISFDEGRLQSYSNWLLKISRDFSIHDITELVELFTLLYEIKNDEEYFENLYSLLIYVKDLNI